MNDVLIINDLTKKYQNLQGEVVAIDKLSLNVKNEEFVAMFIPSQPARIVLQDSTAVADAQQTDIMPIRISEAIMKSDASSRGSVWSAPS